jgi:hypothetical protein
VRATLFGLGEWPVEDERLMRNRLRAGQPHDVTRWLFRISLDDFPQVTQLNLHHVHLSKNLLPINTGMRKIELSDSFDPRTEDFYGCSSKAEADIA